MRDHAQFELKVFKLLNPDKNIDKPDKRNKMKKKLAKQREQKKNEMKWKKVKLPRLSINVSVFIVCQYISHIYYDKFY